MERIVDQNEEIIRLLNDIKDALQGPGR